MKIKVDDFDLELTMDSGQVFGFTKDAAKGYTGSLAGVHCRFSQEGNVLAFDKKEALPRAEAVAHYFDLHHDLSLTYSILESDEKLRGLGRSLKGLRLIRQDAWQGLACFILSSNNNVKRIQHIHRNLIRHFEQRRKSGLKGFPSALEIASSHEGVLRELGLGYRAPFLWAASKYVAGNPACLDHIREAEYAEACEKVIAFPGIGPKVADCVLLYAFQKYEAFPVDVWILRIMRKLYFRNRSVSEKKIQEFGQKRWGKDAGYVQQYLFHGARTGII